MKSVVGIATCLCLLLIAERAAAYGLSAKMTLENDKRLDILEQRFKDQEIKLKMATHVESGSFTSSFYNKKSSTIISHHVEFEKPYSGDPHIILSLELLDAEEEHNLRYDLKAVQVTGSSFIISLKTWLTTTIYKARVSWVAIPKLQHSN